MKYVFYTMGWLFFLAGLLLAFVVLADYGPGGVNGMTVNFTLLISATISLIGAVFMVGAGIMDGIDSLLKQQNPV